MSFSKESKHARLFWQTKFITATEIRLINARIQGPIDSRVRDEALLKHNVILPIIQQISGKEKDLPNLAGNLASNSIRNPVFADGNKRTALLAAGLFLLQNGMLPRESASRDMNNDVLVVVHCGLSTGMAGEQNMLTFVAVYGDRLRLVIQGYLWLDIVVRAL